MAWKRKRKVEEGPSVTFDVAARFKYLTGFRKRKLQRQRQGARQVMEKERQDRIDVKREHREEIKKHWRQLMWAERRADRLFGPAALEDEGGSKRKRRRKAALINKAAAKVEELEESEAAAAAAGPAAEPVPVTVAFDAEDDDPFGGCEVTTTVGAVGGPSSAALGEMGAEAGGDPAGRLWVALPGQRSAFAGAHGAGDDERGLAVPSRAAEDEERRQKRVAALRREEARRQAALSRKLSKVMAQKKREKPKKGKAKAKNKGKNAKAGARARRRRKQ